MKLLTAPSFDRCIKSLDVEGKRRVLEAMRMSRLHYGDPHRHTGAGIRYIGDMLECRDALGKRLLFIRERDALVFLYYGDHDAVRVFAKKYSK
jgi:hypothetical protein